MPRYRKALRAIGFLCLGLTVLFIVLTFISASVNAGKLDIYLPDDAFASEFKPQSGIVDIRTDPHDPHHMIVMAKGEGKVFIEREPPPDQIGGVNIEYVQVLPGGMIYDMSCGNFSGYRQMIILFEFYVTSVTALLIASFVIRCRHELFSYNTLFLGGTALFLTSLLIHLFYLKAESDTDTIGMMQYYSIIRSAGAAFLTICLPVMLVFAVSLFVSNVSLIKKEGKRFANLLGFIMSGLIIVGYLVSFFIGTLFMSGSEQAIRVFNTVMSVYETLFAYFEAMLLSASICGMLAARQKPAMNKTHIIILGCGIADDGTPLPLLQGRIDRALAFAEEQQKKTGTAPVFVPSGGKGDDEVISEAESMRNYLISKGIPESRIIPENKSVCTRENMRFSLEKIMQTDSKPEIVFSTSEYHVLRSGIISRNEGLNAEGIGARTKWYFWPNAFVREFVGLLVSKWRQHTFWAVFFIIVFVVINVITPM